MQAKYGIGKAKAAKSTRKEPPISNRIGLTLYTTTISDNISYEIMYLAVKTSNALWDNSFCELFK